MDLDDGKLLASLPFNFILLGAFCGIYVVLHLLFFDQYYKNPLGAVMHVSLLSHEKIPSLKLTCPLICMGVLLCMRNDVFLLRLSLIHI